MAGPPHRVAVVGLGDLTGIRLGKEMYQVMNTAEDWSVMLSVAEYDGETRAEALLVRSGAAHISGHGRARRNPTDQNVTKIGEEIAVARALSDLAHRLMQVATADVKAVVVAEATSLRAKVAEMKSSDPVTEAHLRQVERDLQRFIQNGTAPRRSAAPPPVMAPI